MDLVEGAIHSFPEIGGRTFVWNEHSNLLWDGSTTPT